MIISNRCWPPPAPLLFAKGVVYRTETCVEDTRQSAAALPEIPKYHQNTEILYPGLNKNAALPFSAFQQAFGYCAGMPQLALQLISQVLSEKDSLG